MNAQSFFRSGRLKEDYGSESNPRNQEKETGCRNLGSARFTVSPFKCPVGLVRLCGGCWEGFFVCFVVFRSILDPSLDNSRIYLTSRAQLSEMRAMDQKKYPQLTDEKMSV